MVDLTWARGSIVIVSGNESAGKDQNWLRGLLVEIGPSAIATCHVNHFASEAVLWAEDNGVVSIRYRGNPAPKDINSGFDSAVEKERFMVEHSGVRLAIISHGAPANRLWNLCDEANVRVIRPWDREFDGQKETIPS